MSIALKPKDFASDQEVRWCPGCGDYAILKAVQKTCADLGVKTEETVFVSGIGCSSRFPYYMSTYGFHTIHGRAPAFATGIKLANPELDVWLITGDGDGLSIGGNHLLHVLRRNVNLQILLFNNEIYGLTKGQASPTSRKGTTSPSTPEGSPDTPLNPMAFALGAGARFLARGVDTQIKELSETLKRAHTFEGAAFVEIFQNCLVYNDGVFADFTERDHVADRQLQLVHGEPMIFGKERNKALRLKPGSLSLEVVEVDAVEADSLLVHDETNRVLAGLLAEMGEEFPIAQGVLYCEPESQAYEKEVTAQLVEHTRRPVTAPVQGDLNALLRQGHTWTVK